MVCTDAFLQTSQPPHWVVHGPHSESPLTMCGPKLGALKTWCTSKTHLDTCLELWSDKKSMNMHKHIHHHRHHYHHVFWVSALHRCSDRVSHSCSGSHCLQVAKHQRSRRITSSRKSLTEDQPLSSRAYWQIDVSIAGLQEGPIMIPSKAAEPHTKATVLWWLEKNLRWYNR